MLVRPHHRRSGHQECTAHSWFRPRHPGTSLGSRPCTRSIYCLARQSQQNICAARSHQASTRYPRDTRGSRPVTSAQSCYHGSRQHTACLRKRPDCSSLRERTEHTRSAPRHPDTCRPRTSSTTPSPSYWPLCPRRTPSRATRRCRTRGPRGMARIAWPSSAPFGCCSCPRRTASAPSCRLGRNSLSSKARTPARPWRLGTCRWRRESTRRSSRSEQRSQPRMPWEQKLLVGNSGRVCTAGNWTRSCCRAPPRSSRVGTASARRLPPHTSRPACTRHSCSRPGCLGRSQRRTACTLARLCLVSRCQRRKASARSRRVGTRGLLGMCCSQLATSAPLHC